jgi:hypothetical protein
MKAAVLVCLALGLVILPAWAEKRTAQSCQLEQLASLDIVVAEHILLPVDYRGQTLWMVLDLGSPFGLVLPAVIEPLKLRTTKLDARPDEFLMRIGGKPITATAEVDSLKLGSYRISRHDFFVDPRPLPVEAGPDRTVLGTLGISELRSVDFELDLLHRRLNLYSSSHCTGAAAKTWERAAQIPMGLNEFGSVLFPVEVDGSKLVATISTMDFESFMGTDVSRQVFGFDERSPEMELRVDAEHHRHGYYRLMKVVAGDLRLPDVEIRLAPGLRSCTLSKTGMFGEVWEYQGRDGHLCFAAYPLTLGRSAIEHLRLYFATQEKMIYFWDSTVQH